jgi:hypothetical protein
MSNWKALLLSLLLVSCSSQVRRSIASSEDDSCRGQLLYILNDGEVEVISGGHNVSSARIGVTGNYGGAYRTKIKYNGEVIDVVEKKVVVEDYLTRVMSKQSLDKYNELSSEYFKLASEKGLGPKYYGFKDVMEKAKFTRYIYMEEVGAGHEKVKVFKDHLLEDTDLYSLKEVDQYFAADEARKYFKELKVNELVKNDEGRVFPAIQYILSEDEHNKMIDRLRLINKYHPDFHAKNVMVYFVRDKGEIKVHLFGIDWSYARLSLAQLKIRLEALRVYKP